MLVRAVRSWIGSTVGPRRSLFTKVPDSPDFKVWLPKTQADIPEDYVASYPKAGEVEDAPVQFAIGDPSGIPVLIETQRVIQSGAPSEEVPEDRIVRLYANLADLQMDERDQENLVAILGPRFNANKRLIKLTSSKYPSPDENTKHCISMLKELMAAATEMTQKLEAHTTRAASDRG